jgi:hypothetical protein
VTTAAGAAAGAGVGVGVGGIDPTSPKFTFEDMMRYRCVFVCVFGLWGGGGMCFVCFLCLYVATHLALSLSLAHTHQPYHF